MLPSKMIVADIAQRPYECYEYDARADTCKAIARRSVSGNKMTMNATLREFVRGIGTLEISVETTFDIGETQFCGDLGKSKIEAKGGVIPSNFRTQAIETTKRNLSRQGRTCYAYLRAPDGQHYSVKVGKDGKLERSRDDKVWFFSSPKPVS